MTPSLPTILICLAALAAIADAAAQTPVESREPAGSKGLERAISTLITAVDPEESPRLLVLPLREAIASRGSMAATAAARAALPFVESTGTWLALQPRTEELLALHRARPTGDPLALAPTTLILAQVAPDRAETQAAVIETFGTASPIHDAPRALAALHRLPKLLPRRGERITAVATRLLQLDRVAAERRADWLVAEMFDSWLATAEITLASGGTIEPPSTDQLWTLNQLQVAKRHHRSGNSAALQAALRTWRKQRPTHRVPAILFACSQASLGPAYNLARARQTLASATKLGDGDWRALDSRRMLSRFGVPATDEATLREFCTELKRSKRPLTLMADRNWLSKRLPTQSHKLEKKRQAFDTAIARLQRCVNDYERAVGVRVHTGRDQLLDIDPSNAASQAATEWRDWYHAKKAAVRAQRQWQDERVKVDSWRERLAIYERMPTPTRSL
ncbi:MAG: hypothetical protein NXI31_16525 [bacterium]|nr:hypothetical protein [bacterium]